MFFLAKNYLIFVSTLFLFYCIGKTFILLFLKDSRQLPKYFQIFIVLLLGTVISITLFSLWKTSGITINLIFIVLVLFLVMERGELRSITDTGKNTDVISGKDFVILFISSLVIFAYNTTINANEFLVPDHIFYSRISYFLNYTGQENEYYIINTLDENFKGTSPYHYFELWLNALITNFFGGLSINNYLLSTGSILVSIIFIGYLALWERFKKVTLVLAAVTFFILFYGGLLSPLFESIPLLQDYQYVGFSLLLTNISKFSIIYIYVLASLLACLYGLNTISVIFLLFLPVSTFTALPAVSGGLLIFIGICLYFHFYQKKEAIKSVVYLFLTVALIFLFYSWSGNDFINRDSTSVKDIFGLVKSIQLNEMKIRLNIFAGSTIAIFILYLPLLILISIIIYRKYVPQGYWIFSINILCLYFSGLVSWCLLADALNSIQVFYLVVKALNIWLSLSAIILISRFNMNTFTKPGIVDVAIILFLIAIPLSQVYYKETSLNFNPQKYSLLYIKNIKNFIDTSGIKTGVFIKDSSEYTSVFSKYPTFSTLGDYLPSINNNAVAISISEFSIPISTTNYQVKERELKAIKMGAFYHFVQNEKKTRQFTSIEESQIKFIKNNNLRFIIASSNAKIPPLIKPLVKEAYIDDKTGEKFLLLKY